MRQATATGWRLARGLALAAGLGLGLGLPLPRPAWAETPLVALQTKDASRAFLAVGKLIMAGREFCTGTLVAPELVLTAAHCLYDQRTGARFAESEIRFLDGWRNGRAEAYRGVRAAAVYPGYAFGAPDETDRVSRDLALIALDQPILLSHIPPFAMQAIPPVEAAVSVVSYGQDRAEAPSLQQICHVMARQDALLILTCEVDFGSSGAPVLVERGEGLAVATVVAAKAEAAGRRVALASARDDIMERLLEELAKLLPRQGTGQVRVLSGGGAIGGEGGAKVIKAAPAEPVP